MASVPSKDAAPNSRRDKRRWAIMAGLLALAGAIWLAHAPLLRGVARLWVISEALSPADAVVVLGGGAEQRAAAAADIYRRGLATRVLVAQAGETGDLGESARATAILLRAGVPAAAVVPLGAEVTSTYDEARAVASWAAKTGVKRVIVPTDWFHTRRVRWTFERLLAPVGTRVEVAALPPAGYAAGDWWRSPEARLALANEFAKYVYYRLRYAFVPTGEPGPERPAQRRPG